MSRPADNPNPVFWRGKRVLITGHTGFKGAWLALWMRRLGAEVTGISLAPATKPNLFSLAHIDEVGSSHFCDIRDYPQLAALIHQSEPQVVFHLAAQALVRPGYRDPLTTFATNVQGTAHVLDALRPLQAVRAVVVVTTDKVYQNLEHAYPYRETDALGGHDPYSASKAAAEMVIACYRDSYFAEKGVALASVRAGNVIGGGDWSEDRLIPDAVRAWQAGCPLNIRYPLAIRPWQHVLEPLCAYIKLAERLIKNPEMAGAFNMGPETHEAASVKDVVTQAQIAYGHGDIVWGDEAQGPHEAGRLTLEIAKTRTTLGITPRWGLPVAIERTMQWYRQHSGGLDARSACEQDLDAFESTPQH